MKTGGSKLFKPANLEARADNGEALNVLKERAKAGIQAASMEQPPTGARSPELAGTNAPADSRGSAAQQAPATAPGPVASAKKQNAPPVFPEEDDDDEAFLRSVEQCLKECDVMWDEY